jgi:hypothetical protein
MKKILLVLMIFLICIWGFGEKFKQSIIVTSPQKDKVYLTSGSLPIAWKTIGVYGKLAIHLRKHDDSQWIKLISGIRAGSTTSYSHPLGHITPGRYLVRVKQMGTTVKGKSGIFWVRSPPQKPPKIQSIIFTFPKKGEHIPCYLQGVYARWKSSGLSGDVIVSIHRRDGSWFKIISAECPIDEEYIDLFFSEGGGMCGHDYYFKIVHIETSFTRKSPVFKID